MNVVEPVKRFAEKITRVGLPSREQAAACIVDRRPVRMKFRDDGYIPNNPKYPLLYYRRAVRFSRKLDPAAVLETTFNENCWGDAWRDGIYDFVHYHSMIHEVLGVAIGSATIRLGGNKGRTIQVSAGDLIIVPAGVGHECLRASKKFLVVGAYPPKGTYNECRGSFQERDKAIASIRRVGAPERHPLYGVSQPVW